MVLLESVSLGCWKSSGRTFVYGHCAAVSRGPADLLDTCSYGWLRGFRGCYREDVIGVDSGGRYAKP